MTLRKYAGIDYSLSCPCICTYEGESENFSFSRCEFTWLTDTKKYAITRDNLFGKVMPKYSSDMERYANISDWALVALEGSRGITIEGYSMGSTGRVFNLAENAGILKYRLYNLRYSVDVVPPTVIKKFATGKGNANKWKMQDTFIKETGIDLKEELGMTELMWSPSGDIIDAFYMCKYEVMKNDSASTTRKST